jgi:hypothetical protein
MSLKADRTWIRAKLAQLEDVEMRARRYCAASATSTELRQRELDTIVAERKRWQGLLAKQVNDELDD